MSKNKSVDFFLRFLQERFHAFRGSLTQFLSFLTLEDRNQKIEAAQDILSKLNDLKSAMSVSDHPTWIVPLESKFQRYIKAVPSHGDAGLKIIQAIMQYNPAIESQTWKFVDLEVNSAIDFDAVYQEYYRGSRVPELFDELVSQLEKIIEDGEIDSVATIKSLENLIATIKKNARSDYFSTRGTWEFTQSFFKNLTIEALESTPGLKQAFKAFRKTMSEMDIEMSQVTGDIRKRLIELVKADLPILEYRPLALPSPVEEETDEAN